MSVIIAGDQYAGRDRSIATIVPKESGRQKVRIGMEGLFLIISREKPYFCIRMKQRL